MRIFRNLIGRVLTGAVALLGLGQPGAVQAAPWKANADDALLFDVRLGQYRLGDGIRGYQTGTGVCLDLGDTIMALDLPIRLDKKLRRATGWAFEENHSIVIDREANTVQIMNRRASLSGEAIYDTPEGWCVSISVLSSWLGVGLTPDLGNALLFVKSENKLPVQAQMERRSRAAKVPSLSAFDLKDLPQRSARFGGVRLPAVDVVASVGGLKQPAKRGGGQLNASYEIYAAGEVGPVAYNARLSSNPQGVPNSLRVQAYRSDPNGQLLGPLRATTVAAGDISGYSTPLVAISNAGRGAMVTNRPIERHAAFDTTDFRGELPRGWDAELYRNGQLLMFANDRADGRYEFLDVPLLYGQNRFEIVLYGPQGQIRREERTVPVGLDSIPPRKTYYWAGVYDEGRDLIGLGGSRLAASGWRGSLGVERGLNAKTSFAALIHSLVLPDGVRRNYAELAVRRALGPTLLELSGSRSHDGGAAVRAQILGELEKTYFNIESIWASGGYQADRVLRDVTGQHTLSLDHIFSVGRGVLPAHVEARYTTRRNGVDSLEAGARVSTNVGRIALTGQLDWRDDRRSFGPDPPGELDASLLANARVGRVRLRGEARYRIKPDPRFDTLALVAEWSAGKDDRFRNDWRAEIGYDQPLHRARAGFGYIRRFEKLSVTASVEAATDGSVAAGLNLAFSVGPDPRGGGVRMTSSRQATQGQALARVFRDRNGDGIWQAGEPLEKDVQISAGRVPVDILTGGDGRVVVDGLEPYQPVLISVDASSLPDPLVQPRGQGIVVMPRPGVAISIDLPLAAAGEVDGTLVRSGGGGFEGVDLELVDVEGRIARTTKSEYDGYFLFEGVPYGRYTIRIAKLSADAARLAQGLEGVALVGEKTPTAHLGAIAAQPQIRQAAN